MKIKAEPISVFKPGSTETRFGKLEFLGGLVLTSKHDDFGGISGIRFVKDNNFIAVTDKARVITGRLERKNGKPHAIKGEEITRIKAANGKTITGADDKDAESIELAGNQFLVGYERNDRILRLNLRGRKLIADGSYKIDFEPYDFPDNKGPEAMALDPNSGKLFAFAEYALNSKGNHQGFIISGGKVEKTISMKERNGFSLTDAHFLPNGDLLMLERYYNPFTGPFMRMRRVAKADLFADTPLDGEILIDVDDDYEIDNIEGLAISQMDDGSARLTLVSDDNFSKRQRTVLLEFKLLD
ncbi:MAG: esterase-like activity of phytase family protein [Rhizobiaceae bacterium]|nr:esterase-like activity of phytase family protein [Rhizobiaceae bacterium]